MSVLASIPGMTTQRAGSAVPDDHERELAAEAYRTLQGLPQSTDDVALAVTAEGRGVSSVRVPASVLRLLVTALSEMACGNGVSVLPLHTELSTQEAADLLNVSRPYLVGLLEKGEMAYRKVGSQRRVRLQEVLAYKARSDIDRRAALNELAQLGQDIGVGHGA